MTGPQVLAESAAAVRCAPLAAGVLSESDASLVAGRFAALADPVRVRLVSMLLAAEGGAVCVCDLVGPTGRSQGTVSSHLAKLVAAGLCVSERRGRNVWYSVNPAALEALRALLAAA